MGIGLERGVPGDKSGVSYITRLTRDCGIEREGGARTSVQDELRERDIMRTKRDRSGRFEIVRGVWGILSGGKRSREGFKEGEELRSFVGAHYVALAFNSVGGVDVHG